MDVQKEVVNHSKFGVPNWLLPDGGKRNQNTFKVGIQKALQTVIVADIQKPALPLANDVVNPIVLWVL